MHGENGTPVTPDWVPTPRGWNEPACCPADCTMCGDYTIPDSIELGSN